MAVPRLTCEPGQLVQRRLPFQQLHAVSVRSVGAQEQTIRLKAVNAAPPRGGVNPVQNHTGSGASRRAERARSASTAATATTKCGGHRDQGDLPAGHAAHHDRADHVRCGPRPACGRTGGAGSMPLPNVWLPAAIEAGAAATNAARAPPRPASTIPSLRQYFMMLMSITISSSLYCFHLRRYGGSPSARIGNSSPDFVSSRPPCSAGNTLCLTPFFLRLEQAGQSRRARAGGLEQAQLALAWLVGRSGPSGPSRPGSTRGQERRPAGPLLGRPCRSGGPRS